MCSKFTREHPCRNMISMKLLCDFIEITLRHGCSPVILQHISRTRFFYNNTYGGLLLWRLSMILKSSKRAYKMMFFDLQKHIYSILYTLRWKTNVKKNSFRQNKFSLIKIRKIYFVIICLSKNTFCKRISRLLAFGKLFKKLVYAVLFSFKAFFSNKYVKKSYHPQFQVIKK